MMISKNKDYSFLVINAHSLCFDIYVFESQENTLFQMVYNFLLSGENRETTRRLKNFKNLDQYCKM